MVERAALLIRYRALTEQVVRLVEQEDWLSLQSCLEDRAQVEHQLLALFAGLAASEREQGVMRECVACLEPLLPQLTKAREGVDAKQSELDQEQQDHHRVGRNLQRIGSAYR
ncbi:hypothetical protein OL229_13745 [Neisseriaceae bacterium JH1-16]|nr:hypothetical protein [Neisseriaceae bacterium JH1-16]